MKFPLPIVPIRVSPAFASPHRIRFEFAYRALRSVALAATTLVILICAACAGTGNPGGGQTSLPAIPAGLTATAGNTQVTLTWSATTGATSYHVKRSTSSGAETQIAAPASNTFTDNTAANGTKYFYVVSAVNSEGESANSNEVSATPAAPPTAPPAPTGLQGAPGNAKVNLTWNPSSGATSYHV